MKCNFIGRKLPAKVDYSRLPYFLGCVFIYLLVMKDELPDFGKNIRFHITTKSLKIYIFKELSAFFNA